MIKMKLSDLFKSKVQRKKEALTKEYLAHVKEQEAIIDKHLAQVRFFPGSVSEYGALVGYNVQILDTGDRDMRVIFSRHYNISRCEYDPWICIETLENKKLLVKNGIEAIVNCYNVGDSEPYDYMHGLPVANAESNSK